MGKIAKYLNQLTVGNVFDNQEILEIYSTDASALRIKPKFVAFPEYTDDIQKLMKFFDQLAKKGIGVPIAVRGSGLGEGGASLTNGLVISTEKLNKLLEIDTREKLVRVQSGITLKELNTALSVSGLTIPIDGEDNKTIGDLIAECPTDSSFGKYGGIKNYVERIEVVLANGDCIQTDRFKKYAVAKLAAEKTTEGNVYRKLIGILRQNEDFLRKINTANQAGYPQITSIEEKNGAVDIKPLFFGSQGTLGVISEVILRAKSIKEHPARLVGVFREMSQALSFLDAVKEFRPRILDIYDMRIIIEAREAGKNLDGVIKKLDGGYAVFASFDEKGQYFIKKTMDMREQFPRNARFIYESKENRRVLNEFSNSLNNYLNHARNGERVPILTDFYLPSRNLENFIKDLEVLATKLDLDLSLYGSYMAENYSLRPKFNLEDADFSKKATTFLKAGAYVIERQEGLLASGTPEGRLKAVAINPQMSAPEIKIYNEIKEIFDPNKILSPDIKLGASSKFTLTHFRNANLPKIMI